METVGGISGGVLGYIGGNIPGAAAGYFLGRRAGKSYQKMLSRKRKSHRTGSTPYVRQSKRIRRSRSLRTTKRKRTKITRKNSKKIKSIVKRVIECDYNYGIYDKRWVCLMKQTATLNGDSQTVTTVGGRTDGSANPQPIQLPAYQFCAFTPKKFLDAASILYSGKAVNLDWTQPQIGGLPFTNLKLNVHYASVVFEVKNVTRNKQHYEIFECTPRQNLVGIDCVRVFEDSVNSETWVGGVPGVTRLGMRPTQFEKFKTKYSVKSMNKVLNPGEKFTMVRTWKGCIDYNKLLTLDATPTLCDFARGMTKEFMFVVKPEVKIGNSIDAAANIKKVGFYDLSTGLSTYEGTTVNVSEYYKIQQPDETADTQEGMKRCFQTFVEAEPTGFKVDILNTRNEINVTSGITIP